jgi:hypothetical protein
MRRKNKKDLMKEARKVAFLKNFYGIKRGNNRNSHSEKSINGIAKDLGKSIHSLYRLEKLNNLIPPLQEKVSSGKLGLMAAVELSNL